MKVLRVIIRTGSYALAFILPIGALAALGFYSTRQRTQPHLVRILPAPSTGCRVGDGT
jgi:hypothetical protein